MGALQNVQKFFPGVTKVVDALKPAYIEVTAGDATKKGIKNHEACAMAQACKRKFGLDGVIISRSTAYLVKGKKARRFLLPGSVTKEVISFDRGAGFAPGKYKLNPIPEAMRLGVEHDTRRNERGSGEPARFRHFTTGVRSVLAGYDPD